MTPVKCVWQVCRNVDRNNDYAAMFSLPSLPATRNRWDLNVSSMQREHGLGHHFEKDAQPSFFSAGGSSLKPSCFRSVPLSWHSDRLSTPVLSSGYDCEHIALCLLASFLSSESLVECEIALGGSTYRMYPLRARYGDTHSAGS